MRESIQRSLEAGDRYSAEYRQLRPDGTFSWMETTGTILFDKEARPERMIGVCTDISARKINEEEVKTARAELEKRVIDRTMELQRAENALRALSGRLLQMQDEERRRIARELHDSAGQILAALKMSLFPVQQRAKEVDPDIVGSLSRRACLSSMN